MTPEQAQQIKDLYDATFELSLEERAHFLDTVCQDNPELRAVVEEMLQLPEEDPAFLEDRPLSSPATTDASAAIGRRVGPYQILSEIGRGGMGVVYLAQRADEAYQQQVAIKLVWPGIDHEAVNRFRQERQILARLNHPNIARLLDGGATEEGWQYLVMEYIEGVPINVYCEERQLGLEERLHLFRIVCKAVQYAHQNLVIHRDLKPSNILIKADGTVKLLDFGIAKLMVPTPESSVGATVFTHTGLHPLTPDYASPEQVRGEEITTASDVYSLGVVLYELLTGRKPYRIQSPLLLEVARAVCEQEPMRPSMLRRGEGEKGRKGDQNKEVEKHFLSPSPLLPFSLSQLSGDLDNIVLKALKKEVMLRYASVEQLAEDLRRYSAGEPVLAQADTLSYRAGKFVRRHKASVALGVLLLLTLLTVAIVAVRQAIIARQQAREQRRQLYIAQMNQAQQDWEVNNLPRMRETLERWLPQAGQEDLRSFEWRYLWALRHQELWSTRYQSEFPNGMFLEELKDGRLFLSDYRQTGELIEATTGRSLRTFDMKPYQPFETLFLVSPPTLLRQRDNILQVVFLETGEVRDIATAPPFTSLGPTSDPEIVATGHADGWVRLWHVPSGRLTASYRCLTTPIAAVECFYSSQRMIVRPVDGARVVWDLQHNRRLATLPNLRGAAMSIARNGRYLLLWDGNTRVSVFATETGQELGQVSIPGELLLHSKFTPDSQFLAVTSSDGAARLYELPTLQMKKLFRSTSSWMTNVDISPDGKLLATVCADQTVKLWEIATQTLLKVIRGHEANVWRAVFTRDGQKLATCSEDGTVQLWDVAALLVRDVLTEHQGYVFSVAFAPDGKTLATASQDHTVKLWDAATGRCLRTLNGHADWVFAATFAPDGKTLVTGGNDKLAIWWDVQTGQELQRLAGHEFAVRSIAFTPDGRNIATSSSDHTVRIWELATARTLRTLPGPESEVYGVAIAPDGSKLLAVGGKQFARVWDFTTGKELFMLPDHNGAVWCGQFSPDGKTIATSSADRTIKLWDASNGQLLRTLEGHGSDVFALAWSPDGQRLATGSNDKTIKLWSVRDGLEVLSLRDHSEQIWSVAFAPDGNTLASSSWDKTARIWRAVHKPTGAEH